MRSARPILSAKPGITGKKLFLLARDTINDVNLGVENGIRLAAYKNLRERGVSKAQAASLAKNLTVNFNRRGTLGPVMNSMYLFYNASMQGTARILAATKSKSVRKVLYAAVLSGVLIEILNRFMGGDDDDGELAIQPVISPGGEEP